MGKVKISLLLLSLIQFLSGQAQNESIYNHLENTKKLSVKQISDNNLSQLTDATIYQADLSFDLENSGYGYPVNSAFFLKTGAEYKAYGSIEEILGSDLFINSIKSFFVVY